jgi:hypothetical protein
VAKKTKMHEILAVETDRKGQSKKIVGEAINTFTKKDTHFREERRVYRPKDEEGEKLPEQFTNMVDTVPSKLSWVWKNLARYIDLMATKETSNTNAKADLVLGGVTLAKDVPATALLNLEHQMATVRDVVSKVSTLSPDEKWTPDASHEKKNVYKSEPRDSTRTQKKMKPIIMVQPTEFHPAQVEKMTYDEVVGYWTVTKWSGELSSHDKAEMLERVDKLAAAVKKARMRANQAEVTKVNIAKKLFVYVMDGELDGVKEE